MMTDEPQPELPPDPFINSELLPLAGTAYGMFSAFCAAGFNEPQAMQVTIAVVTTMVTNAQNQPPQKKA